MNPTIFTCGNVLKCQNAIAAEGLNDIQLKALRQMPKTCDACKQTSKWIEQQALFGFTPIATPKRRNGGRTSGQKNSKSTNNAH